MHEFCIGFGHGVGGTCHCELRAKISFHSADNWTVWRDEKDFWNTPGFHLSTVLRICGKMGPKESPLALLTLQARQPFGTVTGTFQPNSNSKLCQFCDHCARANFEIYSLWIFPMTTNSNSDSFSLMRGWKTESVWAANISVASQTVFLVFPSVFLQR